MKTETTDEICGFDDKPGSKKDSFAAGMMTGHDKQVLLEGALAGIAQTQACPYFSGTEIGRIWWRGYEIGKSAPDRDDIRQNIINRLGLGEPMP